ncbi:MAG: hypothetical protein DRP09_18840 [Candidatus Thorarchaeota archaeon]|nr:MAG: hypothetical protein DRP09_18840 [Candidatus Thorarchaeota archaeon]
MPKTSWMTTIAGFSPLGSHTQNTSLSSVVTLTPPNDAVTKLLIQATGKNVRFTLDGTNPTTSKGFRLTVGDPALLIMIERGVTVKVIGEHNNAVIDYQWGQ